MDQSRQKEMYNIAQNKSFVQMSVGINIKKSSSAAILQYL